MFVIVVRLAYSPSARVRDGEKFYGFDKDGNVVLDSVYTAKQDVWGKITK
ncbi:MAG: hypothetical protein J6T38_09950 [Bacteroidaceae bacterium]|nr:hypothetical protein [Bacteroidaceae bacterium]